MKQATPHSAFKVVEISHTMVPAAALPQVGSL